jgi:hypothetical protein
VLFMVRLEVRGQYEAGGALRKRSTHFFLRLLCQNP